MTKRKDTGVVNIHGREYKTVALRVQEFREAHPDWTLRTEIVSADDPVIMRAIIEDETGRVLATGHAEEKRGATQINRTSPLENAETSAIGRALAALGFGGSEFATADEVANAIVQQASQNGRDQLSERRKAVSKKLMEAFAGNMNAIREWLESNNFGEVRSANAETLDAIEKRLAA